MTLVVMAAGMGSRFGGLKQLTPLTDDNEFIIDEGMSDYQMLINYLTDELKGNLSEKYSDVEGRITIK